MNRSEFLELCVMIGTLNGEQINLLWNGIEKGFDKYNSRIRDLEQDIKLYKEQLQNKEAEDGSKNT